MAKNILKTISITLGILVSLSPIMATASTSHMEGSTFIPTSIDQSTAPTPSGETASETPPIPNTLQLDPTTVNIEKGRMSTIQTIFTQENGEQLNVPAQDINWTSSDPSIAAIFQGKVSGVRLGNAQITASYNGKEAVINVTVVKPTSPVKSGPKFNFFELVSNTGQFDNILSNYSLSELKVAIPEQAFKSGTINTNNFTTNIEVTTSQKVRKVTVGCNGNSFDAIQTATNNFERSIPGLRVGDEITIRAYDVIGNELQMFVTRLTDGTTTIKEDYGLLTKKEYTLKELTENKDLFNELLRLYSLSDLQITGPLRYIDKISADHTPWFTFFNIQTFAPAEKITIEINGVDYDARYQSNNLYTREITGVEAGDQATIKVIDEFGSLIEKKVVSIED